MGLVLSNTTAAPHEFLSAPAIFHFFPSPSPSILSIPSSMMLLSSAGSDLIFCLGLSTPVSYSQHGEQPRVCGNHYPVQTNFSDQAQEQPKSMDINTNV